MMIVAIATTVAASAQSFDAKFDDATLRLDYTFMGNATEQYIAIADLSRLVAILPERGETLSEKLETEE